MKPSNTTLTQLQDPKMLRLMREATDIVLREDLTNITANDPASFSTSHLLVYKTQANN